MRLAGYIHRDISGGNCLWYDHGAVGKISDLEYAIPMEDITGDDPITVCLSLSPPQPLLTPHREHLHLCQ